MQLLSLFTLKKNEAGIIEKIDASLLPLSSKMVIEEIEARLLEMGFIEGAKVQVVFKGAFGDPIAVRINNNNSIISLRKNESSIILVNMGKLTNE
ncbi:MAG TPA: FeoA domain-containing protein [Burkholderiales bacterium]|nr:FeoA domain-containing protein [Burkholderiales bacterium]